MCLNDFQIYFWNVFNRADGILANNRMVMKRAKFFFPDLNS